MKRDSSRYITGFRKAILYTYISLSVMLKYLTRPALFQWSLRAFCLFLLRSFRLLLAFRHHKAVRVEGGYKLDLYLPAFPSKAFFSALEGKVIRKPPSPVTVVFSTTKACQYRCSHCYQRKDENADMDETLMVDTAKALQEMGVAMFDIEGGEPFLRYSRLLSLIKSLDERSELWVNTTGAGIKSGMLEELKKYGLFGLMISIHSPDPKNHDALTGVEGSFDLACKTVGQCRAVGLTAAINSVLSEEEVRIGGLDRLMFLARKLDADFVQLIHPKPAGMWLGHKQGMQTDPGLIAFIQQEHIRYNSHRYADYPSLSAQVFEESEKTFGCTSGGIDRFYVNASGEIQPCEFLNISFGNVRDEPLTTVFARMRSAYTEPCCDWLCVSQGENIYHLMERYETHVTPLPWTIVSKLVKEWHRGKPTPLYEKLGIYR
ncbi:MAG TPA: radical SAM protein [Syntrophorhabdaceae bacterium]|nr:radical SAM protein [Syntrophorhabdaceae bacterium]